MAVVIICSDFGSEGNKVSHCYHCFPIYLSGFPIYRVGVMNLHTHTHTHIGVPQLVQWVKNLPKHRRHEFDSWVRKIPWKRVWQPTLVFLHGECHGQRSLVGYSPWYHKESDTTAVTEHTHTHTHTRMHIYIYIYIYIFP